MKSCQTERNESLAAAVPPTNGDEPKNPKPGPLYAAATVVSDLLDSWNTIDHMVRNLPKLQTAYAQIGIKPPRELEQALTDLIDARYNLSATIEHIEACVKFAG